MDASSEPALNAALSGKRKRALDRDDDDAASNAKLLAPLRFSMEDAYGEQAAEKLMPPIPDIGKEPLVIVFNGSANMVWNPEDCARLRSLGRLCCSPVGLCAAKVATRGKAAAVPLIMNDEELYVAIGACKGLWNVVVVDSRTGKPVDPEAVLKASALAAAASAGSTGHGAAPSPADLEAVLVRRLVFSDLWRRGYRCTPGLKFGVDYLSYTADASQVHAGFMVIIRKERAGAHAGGGGGGAGGGDIAPIDLVAKSRVATTALKICVMAYGDLESDSDIDIASGGNRGGDGGGKVKGKVRYAAFKRMGPGHAVFTASSAGTGPAKRKGEAVAPAAPVSSVDAASAASAGHMEEEEEPALSFMPVAEVLGASGQ